MAAIGPGTAANGRQYSRKISAFTRPANTTAYAVGDLVANNTAAASVTPLSWALAGSRPFEIPGVRLHKTGPTGDVAFRLHLLAASPTVDTAGDNGVFAANVNGSASAMAIFEGFLFGYKDGAQGLLVPISGVIKREYTGDPTTLYGLLEARTAYSPASGEIFSATLIQEFDQ